jgi:CHAT domain-containing protein
MRHYIKIILCLFGLPMWAFPTGVQGQCPEREFLYSRIAYLRDSSTISFQEQLNELLNYNKLFDRCNYRSDSIHVMLLHRIGLMYYKLKDFHQAVDYSKRSIQVIRGNDGKPFIEKQYLIKLYNNLRVYYDSLQLENEMNEATDSMIALSIQFNSGYELVMPELSKRTVYWYNLGDYHKCLTHAATGEAFAQEREDIVYGFYYSLWKVNALFGLKKFGDARHVLDNAQQLLHRAEQSTVPYIRVQLGTLYAQLAEAYAYDGQDRQALQYFQRALQYEKQLGTKEGCAQILTNWSYYLYHKELKDYSKALSLYKQALQYADETEAINIYSNIANVYVERNNYDSASFFFQKAFAQIKPGATESDLLKLPLDEINQNNVNYRVGLVLDKGDYALKRYKATLDPTYAQKAIEIYKIADKFLDRIRVEQSEMQSKLFWRSNNKRLYEHALEACLFSKNIENAFYFFEKSRAVLLLEEINERRWLGRVNMVKQSRLKRKMLSLKNQLSQLKTGDARYAVLQNEMFACSQQLDGIKHSVKVQYANNISSQRISLDDVKNRLLTQHDALIEIFSGDSSVFVLILTKDQNHFKKIDKEAYERASKNFNLYVSDAELLNRDFDGFTKVSRSLHKLVFDEVNIPAGRIIVSPGGIHFPFEALIINKGGKPEYFVEHYAISYTYSTGFLLQLKKEQDANPKAIRFLGVAPVQFSAAMQLATLPNSDQSLRTINNHLAEGKLFTMTDASRNNFLQQFPSYNIIQLYTHASERGVNNEPAIFFADSALALSDLITENIPVAELIVLSACESGTGKLYEGEGVFSFSRGFAALGIPSCVSNLWSVNNEATYRLTELFYENMSEGLPFDIALQRAKLEFMQTSSKQQQLPFYWAGTVLSGKANTIEIARNSPVRYAAFLVPVMIMAFSAFFVQSAKRFFT